MTIIVEQALDYDFHEPGHIDIKRHSAFGQVSLYFKAKGGEDAHVTLDMESTFRVLAEMDNGVIPAMEVQGAKVVEELHAEGTFYERRPWLSHWLPRWGWMAFGAVVLTGLQFAGFPSPARAGGDGLPPEPYRSQAQHMLVTGEGPGWLAVSQRELQRRCDDRRVLWGCHVDLMGMTVVYVLRDLSPRDRRLTLVHEYAHDLGWRHP